MKDRSIELHLKNVNNINQPLFCTGSGSDSVFLNALSHRNKYYCICICNLIMYYKINTNLTIFEDEDKIR